MVFTLLIANASPAAAADTITFYDYRDYETSYYIDGDNDIVFVELPLTWFYIIIECDDLCYKKHTHYAPGQVVQIYLPRGCTTYFNFYPFGTPFDLQFSGGTTVMGNFLDIEDFPEGSVFYYTIEYGANWLGNYVTLNDDPISNSIYVDVDGKVVSDFDNEVGVSTYTSSEWFEKVFTNTIHQVAGSKGFAFGHRPFTATVDPACPDMDVVFSFKITSVQLILSIPSLYRMREDSAVTNGLLKEILNALDVSSGGASGEFNNSINGATGDLGAMGDKLSGIKKPTASEINTDISAYVDSSVSNDVYGIYGLLWESPMILNMLFIMLTLATCSYVLFGKKG